MVHTAAVLSSVTLGAVVLATACTPSAAERAPRDSGSTSASAAHPCDQERPKIIDMAKLAWLAEKADGKRNEVFRLVIDKDGDPQLRARNEKADSTDCDTKVKVKTEALEGRKEVPFVVLHVRDAKPDTLRSDKDFDAVFWTQSSVEKFVWPYYHSHRLWNDSLEAIRKEFDDKKTAFAIAHQAPSRSISQGRRIASPVDEIFVGEDSAGVLKWTPALEFVGR